MSSKCRDTVVVLKDHLSTEFPDCGIELETLEASIALSSVMRSLQRLKRDLVSVSVHYTWLLNLY